MEVRFGRSRGEGDLGSPGVRVGFAWCAEAEAGGPAVGAPEVVVSGKWVPGAWGDFDFGGACGLGSGAPGEG